MTRVQSAATAIRRTQSRPASCLATTRNVVAALALIDVQGPATDAQLMPNDLAPDDTGEYPLTGVSPCCYAPYRC